MNPQFKDRLASLRDISPVVIGAIGGLAGGYAIAPVLFPQNGPHNPCLYQTPDGMVALESSPPVAGPSPSEIPVPNLYAEERSIAGLNNAPVVAPGNPDPEAGQGCVDISAIPEDIPNTDIGPSTLFAKKLPDYAKALLNPKAFASPMIEYALGGRPPFIPEKYIPSPLISPLPYTGRPNFKDPLSKDGGVEKHPPVAGHSPKSVPQRPHTIHQEHTLIINGSFGSARVTVHPPVYSGSDIQKSPVPQTSPSTSTVPPPLPHR